MGITGHRNIREQDRGELQKAIRSILLELKSKYGATPLILLSALAEGADRLAAEVALSDEIRARLFVPMPTRQAVYERDFAGDSLAKFRSLLAQAEGFVELPLVEGNSSEGIMHPGRERDLQYESVAKYIVGKSQILIALWDGVESGLVGGTSSMVRFQRDGLPPSEACCLEAQEGFPVYWIPTPRETLSVPKGTPFERQDLYPHSFQGDDALAAGYYRRMFSRIDEFNHYVAGADSDLRAEIVKSKTYLLRGRSEVQLPEEVRAELNRFGLADALALRFRHEKVHMEKLLHVTIFAAFLSFTFFAHLFHHPGVLLLSLLLLAYGYWRWSGFRKGEGDTKFQDYRAMAEGLRVRFFWRLVGLSDAVTDHYLGKQRSELDWIRNGFRGWDVRADSSAETSEKDLLDRIETVRTNWVEAQKEYFRGAAGRDERHLERFELWGKIFASFGVGVGTIVLLFVCYKFRSMLLDYEYFRHNELESVAVVLFLVEAALALAALLHNYANRMAYREHAKQYGRMEGVFSRAAESIREHSDPRAAVECLESLGKEALSENGDWVLLHRERPLEVPHP